MLSSHFDEIFGSGYSVSVFTDWQGGRHRSSGSSCGPRGSLAPWPRWMDATPGRAPAAPDSGQPAANATPQLGVPGAWHERLPHFRAGPRRALGQELQSEYLLPRQLARGRVRRAGRPGRRARARAAGLRDTHRGPGRPVAEPELPAGHRGAALHLDPGHRRGRPRCSPRSSSGSTRWGPGRTGGSCSAPRRTRCGRCTRGAADFQACCALRPGRQVPQHVPGQVLSGQPLAGRPAERPMATRAAVPAGGARHWLGCGTGRLPSG